MNKIYTTLIIIVLILFSLNLKSQNEGGGEILNSANKMMNSDSKLTIGGYAQIDYNQPFENGISYNGKVDVHRLVLLFGYRFTDKLSFITEIEVEHVKEIYVEQAFINYSINNYINIRAGLMLVPMGIINEYHEPTTFNGVERPLIDKYISPTTWREIGFGLAGSIPEVSMKYQAYIVNGFAGYKNGESLLSAKNGLRKGRQKGAESFISAPNFTARVEYYGILGLNLGLSGYFGKTQSTLYNNLDKSDLIAVATADSSYVGTSMLGFDARYRRKGLALRAQFYYTSLSNTDQYNYFTSTEGSPNDLGKAMYGYYVEAAYNVFYPFENIKTQLYPFVRYSNYDTQLSVAEGIAKSDGFQNTVITTGLSWKIVAGIAIKSDFQFIKNHASEKYTNTFNAGVAVWF